MNRSWITALTLATVAGSGCAFAGVVANSSDVTPAAAQAPAYDETAFVRVEPQTPTATTVSYQVGAAGTATLSISNGTLVIDNAAPGTGWGITSASGPGTHIDVQFTDGTQLVTFGADLVGSDIAVTVTNAAVAPTASDVTTPSVVSSVNTDAPDATVAVPASQPTPTAVPAAPRPVAVATTTAPWSGDDGGNDHETEPNDD